ncbi:MAG TPA: TIGR03118 family protein [Candidatus Dormibacteraeota bacterium]|nr:TIGR03118 family protein [Candidatus Dormibacteraeota bacterium]
MRFTRASLLLPAVALALAQAVPAQAGTFHGSFHQTNLVSNIPGLAPVLDPDLKNPWGLSSSSGSPIWVSDNNAGVTTLYNGAGQKVPLTVTIPAPDGGPGGAPTGTVFNGTTDFVVSQGAKSGVARFIFDTEDGTIVGWSPAVNLTNAVIAVDRSQIVDSAGDVGAVYKGLASGTVGSANFLYASNFRFGTVDVFDGHFGLQHWAGAFTDSSVPAGFAPFGIQNIGGMIYVTYAKQNGEKHDDVKGPGNGFVDVYTTGGALVRRLASRGSLNSPWGLALAPSTFGNFHDDVLVGNFGDGLISAFTAGGTFRGQLKSETKAPIQNDGLWGLRFGNGGNGGAPGELFFSAGLNDEADGLFGKITPVLD